MFYIFALLYMVLIYIKYNILLIISYAQSMASSINVLKQFAFAFEWLIAHITLHQLFLLFLILFLFSHLFFWQTRAFIFIYIIFIFFLFLLLCVFLSSFVLFLIFLGFFGLLQLLEFLVEGVRGFLLEGSWVVVRHFFIYLIQCSSSLH